MGFLYSGIKKKKVATISSICPPSALWAQKLGSVVSFDITGSGLPPGLKTSGNLAFPLGDANLNVSAECTDGVIGKNDIFVPTKLELNITASADSLISGLGETFGSAFALASYFNPGDVFASRVPGLINGVLKSITARTSGQIAEIVISFDVIHQMLPNYFTLVAISGIGDAFNLAPINSPAVLESDNTTNQSTFDMILSVFSGKSVSTFYPSVGDIWVDVTTGKSYCLTGVIDAMPEAGILFTLAEWSCLAAGLESRASAVFADTTSGSFYLPEQGGGIIDITSPGSNTVLDVGGAQFVGEKLGIVVTGHSIVLAGSIESAMSGSTVAAASSVVLEGNSGGKFVILP